MAGVGQQTAANVHVAQRPFGVVQEHHVRHSAEVVGRAASGIRQSDRVQAVRRRATPAEEADLRG